MLGRARGLGPSRRLERRCGGRGRCSWRSCRASAGWRAALLCGLARLARGRPRGHRARPGGRAGAVPLLLPRARPPVVACPRWRRCSGWSALAPLFVAVAGLARPRWRRAGLAAAGFWWLVVAEVLTGRRAPVRHRRRHAPRADWEASFSDAAADALYPLLASPRHRPAVVWVVFARRAAVRRARALARARRARRGGLGGGARGRAPRRGGGSGGVVGRARSGARCRGRRDPGASWPSRGRGGGSRAGPSSNDAYFRRMAAPMSVLRNLEAKLEGLVEGAFSRAFRSQVQPVELARKLAKEMEERRASRSRAPTSRTSSGSTSRPRTGSSSRATRTA